MKSKKAAMEMSMGTIVTIVLLMSVLVLGLVMVKNIFSSGKGAIDMTDDQLMKQINEIYGDESKVGIYPDTRKLEIKQGKSDGVGVLIRNLNERTSDASGFDVTVSVSELGTCDITEEEAMRYITLGKSTINPINLRVGSTKLHRVNFNIPEGAPICELRYNVDIMSDGEFYDSDDFDIVIKA